VLALPVMHAARSARGSSPTYQARFMRRTVPPSAAGVKLPSERRSGDR
jgi:hypothetical protein